MMTCRFIVAVSVVACFRAKIVAVVAAATCVGIGLDAGPGSTHDTCVKLCF